MLTWLKRLARAGAAERDDLVRRMEEALAAKDEAIAAKDKAHADLVGEFERQSRTKAKLREELDAMRDTVRHLEWRVGLTEEVRALREHLHAIRGNA